MKTANTIVVVLLMAFGTLPVQAQTFESQSFTNINAAIPDGNGSGLSNVRIVTSAISNLTSLRVRLHIAGEFNGDLYSYVRNIQGATTNFCVLLNRVGRTGAKPFGYAGAGLDVVFDAAATGRDIHAYSAITNLPAGTPLTGIWEPDERNVDPSMVLDTTARTTTLSSFSGVSASGEWTLYLADVDSGGTNTLVSWGLDFSGIAAPAVTWPIPADIVYGTALGAAQLNATTPVPGTFSYNPPAGTALNAGNNQTLSATFTPTDLNSYTSVTINVSINVQKAPLTVTAANTNKVYGAALPPFHADYSGFVNSDTTNQLTTQATLSTPATAASAVGSYPITAGGASGSNYTITYVGGTLTIDKASTIGVVTSSRNPALPGQSVAFTCALNAVVPGAGAVTGSVQFRIDGTTTTGPVPLSGGAASYTTSTLAHGTHTVVAEYVGDANFNGATNALAPDQLINTPPVAGPDTIERDPTNDVKVAIATLLSNDSDADGDAISFVGVSTMSTNGSVVSDGTWVFYAPRSNSTNVDAFTYTISDGRGAPVNGSVTVNIRADNGPSPNLTITDLGNNSYQVKGNGIPGRTYRLQFTLDLGNPNWQALGTATANLSGVFVRIDPSGSSLRFYRSVYP